MYYCFQIILLDGRLKVAYNLACSNEMKSSQKHGSFVFKSLYKYVVDKLMKLFPLTGTCEVD